MLSAGKVGVIRRLAGRGKEEESSGRWWAGGSRHGDRVSKTTSSAVFVDEEAMVVKAIKNLRLFSNINTNINTTRSSPLRLTVPDASTMHRPSDPDRGGSEGGVKRSTTVNGVSGTSDETDDKGKWPRSWRSGGHMEDDATALPPVTNRDDPLGAGGNDGSERAGRSAERQDIWKGKGWLLEVSFASRGQRF